MPHPQAAVHHTIVVVDVAGFGDRRRTNHHQVGVRQGLYQAVQSAFRVCGIPWEDCYHEDRGDAVFVLAPADVAKSVFVECVPAKLAAAVREHNESRPPEQRIRLRMALHAGEVHYDEHGVTSASLNLAFRLIAAKPLKAALAESPGILALIVSAWFFEEIVRHTPAAEPGTYRQVRVTEKETSTIAWTCLPDHPYPSDPAHLAAPPPADRAPHQLPAAMPLFTGRTAELAALTATLDSTADHGGTMVISALAGAGGIGKTWLAVRWAQQNIERFPDGQLFVDLRGFSPDDPLPATTALRGFLAALGMDAALVPSDPHAQTARYRELLAHKRMLIILDNAADTAQVAPLLPESETCTVLVTSRRHLHGLVTRHGAAHLNLDVLSGAEARALLTSRIGTARAAAEPDAVEQLLTYCGGFPLALSIVASNANTRPSLSLAALADEFQDLGLDALSTDDPMANLNAVLSWSSTALAPEQARVFGLLGVFPGADIGLPAAAQLAGLPVREARSVLRSLEEMSLLTQDRAGRYRMHDLVRNHAAWSSSANADRNAALRRLVDFYLHVSKRADQLLNHGPIAGEPDDSALVVPDRARAWEWFATEHQSLLAVQQAAADHGWHRAVVDLAEVMVTFHYWRGYSPENLTMWQVADTAATHIGDPSIKVRARRYLGDAYDRLNRMDEAMDSLGQALTLADQARDQPEQAHCHRSLARAWRHCDDNQRAYEHSTRALGLFGTLGDGYMEGVAFVDLGWLAAVLGRYEEAQAHAEASLTSCRQHGNPHGVANALSTLGYVAYCTEDHEAAVGHYRGSIALFREIGDVRRLSEELDEIGHPLVAMGRCEEARTAWQEALTLYEDQRRTPNIEELRKHLDDLPPR